MLNEQEEEAPLCQCAKCGKTFNLEYRYDNHMLTCGNADLRCYECGKKFWNKTQLVNHVKNTHVNNDCPYCGKKCGMKSRLREHLTVHTGVRAFKCGNCDKYFKRKSGLNSHALVCTAGKPVKCGECDESFTQRAALVQHLKTHRVRPCQCDACGEWFRCIKKLRLHMASGLCCGGLKPNQCAKCGAVFNGGRGAGCAHIDVRRKPSTSVRRMHSVVQ